MAGNVVIRGFLAAAHFLITRGFSSVVSTPWAYGRIVNMEDVHVTTAAMSDATVSESTLRST